MCVEYYSIGLLNWKYVCSKYTAPSIKIEETSNVKFMPQSQIQVWVTCLSNLQKVLEQHDSASYSYSDSNGGVDDYEDDDEDFFFSF